MASTFPIWILKMSHTGDSTSLERLSHTDSFSQGEHCSCAQSEPLRSHLHPFPLIFSMWLLGKRESRLQHNPKNILVGKNLENLLLLLQIAAGKETGLNYRITEVGKDFWGHLWSPPCQSDHGTSNLSLKHLQGQSLKNSILLEFHYNTN